jgi:hypothetical protein
MNLTTPAGGRERPGSRILFRSPETENVLHGDIWTIDPDGTGLRQVTHAPAGARVSSASFSPDGTAMTLGVTGVNGQADAAPVLAGDARPVSPPARACSAPSARRSPRSG